MLTKEQFAKFGCDGPLEYYESLMQTFRIRPMDIPDKDYYDVVTKELDAQDRKHFLQWMLEGLYYDTSFGKKTAYEMLSLEIEKR